MMSKKIKILIIAILAIITTFLMSGELFASWSPVNQKPIYPQGDYFCKQKGGAIRFTKYEPDTVIQGYYRSEISKEEIRQNYESTIKKQLKESIKAILKDLTADVKPYKSYTDKLIYYNGDLPEETDETDIENLIGPKVTMTPVFNVASTSSIANTRTAYIFSSGADASPLAQKDPKLQKGNYTGSVSDSANGTTIQEALWNDPTYNEGNLHYNSALYSEALKYEEYYKEITENGYQASIDSSNAQVIVNQEKQTYIIGPYTVKYPDYSEFSYIENMKIITDTGKEVAPTQVICASSTSKVYPGPREQFFVEFSAEEAEYPTSATLQVSFAYLENCTATYERLTGEGKIYQFYGEIEQKFLYHKYIWTDDYDKPLYDAYGNQIGWGQKDDGDDYYEVNAQVKLREVDKYTAQTAAHRVSDSRKWEKVTRETSINLEIELGGKVWEDVKSGKESIVNGIIDTSEEHTEKPMSNVIVTLYREDGVVIGTTKTDDKGAYKFTNLNAMFKYYVKFTYNGQYYEPTTYKAEGTSWEVNSKGTDRRQDRITYNARFEAINSSPVNYETKATYDSTTTWLVKGKVYNQAYTKNDLLGLTLDSDGNYKQTKVAVIDEFGNLYSDGRYVRDINGRLISIDDSSLSSLRNELKSKIQFVKDSLMDSYTYKPEDMNDANNLNGTMDLYPMYDLFVISDTPVVSQLLKGWNIKTLYKDEGNNKHINQGYSRRESGDLAVKKDIEKVTLEINGQKHEYTYDTLENEPTADGTWEINIRLSEAYYNKNYSREIYKSDYLYKVSDYGANYQDYGKSKSDELEVYITYKIMIRNQSATIKTKVEELVDYYDKDLEYVDERSYIQIKTGDNKGTYNTKVSDISRYDSISSLAETTIDGYDKLYVQGLDDKYLTAGQTAYVYLTFKVKKDVSDNESWVRLDEELQSGKEIGVGKENIVEINGYSTIYAGGTKVPNAGNVGGMVAGIVDYDSKPGNLNPNDVPKDGTIKYENFEDDTDKAPNIMIIPPPDESERVISGVVWEDERTESIGATVTGDGKRQEGETLINGVTVQLVELMDNGTEYIWRTFENGSGTADKTAPIINAYNLVEDYKFAEEHDGAYAFKSFVPGKYVVRFIYGDTEKTVLTRDVNTTVNKTLGKTGLNDKSYNGQDFKSTTYQEGIEQNKMYSWRETSTWENGQEQLGNILTEIYTLKADASNNETANAKLNELKAYLYDITASDKVNNASDAKDIESRRNEVINYSDNSVINHIAEVLSSYRDLPQYLGKSYNTTQLQSLIDELIYATNMRAETGVIVVEFEYDAMGTDGNNKDNTYNIQNVDLGLEERPKAQLAINKEVANVKVTLADGSILFDAKSTASNVLWRDHKSYKVGYEGNFMDEDKFGNIVNIRNKNASKFGLIQLSMDEELMHGATMEIIYQVTVTNVGEVDYKDNNFYYRGNVSDTSKVVTTSANKVIDYIPNNLQFNVSNNSAWKVISKDDILSQGLVNTELANQLEKFNTIIITEQLQAQLVPSLYKEKVNENATDSTSLPLVLTQLITSENETDDLTYRNIVEIVETSNSVGRKNEYSVVGNQDPEAEPQELDSDRAEVVKILPPFGNAGIYIVIALITIVATGIIITGIIFIKKKVLRK